MNIEYVNVNGTDIAAVSGGAAEATTPQAALDLAAAAWYEAGAGRHLRRLFPLYQQAPAGLYL